MKILNSFKKNMALSFIFLFNGRKLFKQKRSCQSFFAQTHAACSSFCSNLTMTDEAECILNTPRLLACSDILNQKERMDRKIDALSMALKLYVGFNQKIIYICPSLALKINSKILTPIKNPMGTIYLDGECAPLLMQSITSNFY